MDIQVNSVFGKPILTKSIIPEQTTFDSFSTNAGFQISSVNVN